MRNLYDLVATINATDKLAGTGHHNAEQLLRRLEWTVLRRLDGLLQGDYRTLLRGTGMDLADLREYQFHDDVRHIDWNVKRVPFVARPNSTLLTNFRFVNFAAQGALVGPWLLPAAVYREGGFNRSAGAY